MEKILPRLRLLARLWVVYRGVKTYPLAANVTAVPISDLPRPPLFRKVAGPPGGIHVI